MSIVPSRRGFLFGVAGLLAAPAIVRVSSLMPVKVFEPWAGPEVPLLSFGLGPHGFMSWLAMPGDEIILPRAGGNDLVHDILIQGDMLTFLTQDEVRQLPIERRGGYLIEIRRSDLLKARTIGKKDALPG